MIGLFLGDTDFSEVVLKKIKKLRKDYFVIDFSKNNKFKKDKNCECVKISQKICGFDRKFSGEGAGGPIQWCASR